MTQIVGITRVDRLLASEEATTNDLGNEVRTTFLMHADRYLFDFGLDREEWREFDTGNDASYFGVWMNKWTLQILEYAEGDLTLTQCKNPEQFDREVAARCAFYEEKPAYVVIDHDEESVTSYFQARAEFFIDPKRASIAEQEQTACARRED